MNRCVFGGVVDECCLTNCGLGGEAAAAHFVRIRSLTVTTMNERSRSSRATIPGGDGLLGFGVGNVGEAVSRIVTIADLP